MKSRIRINDLSLSGLLLATALILGYVESLIPILPSIPGIKVGLPNVILLLLLYKKDFKIGFVYIICILRVVLSAVLFGTLISFVYALFGGLCSLSLMVVLKRNGHFGISGVSVFGAFAHNTAQLLVAALLTGSLYVFYYFPVLLLAGSICGFICGVIALRLTKYINR